MRLPLRVAMLIAGLFALAVAIAGFATFYPEGEAKPARVVPSMTNDELLADLGQPTAEGRGCPIGGGEELYAYAYVRQNQNRVEIICVPPTPPGPAQ